MKFLRRTLGPLFLILMAPPSAILIWYINTQLGGSLASLWQMFQNQGVFQSISQIWAPVFFGSANAWAIIGTFMLTQLILMRVVPGKKSLGPLTPNGNTPVYKANGVACFLITIGLFVVTSYGLNWFSPTIVYDNFGAILGALNIFSLLFCVMLYLKGRFKPSSTDNGITGNVIFDYYWGTELYPRIFGWDIKQFTNCRFGMMSWPVIILSFAAKQSAVYGLTNSMWVAVAIMLAYIFKFFVWEMGYMRSLDIMHDRAGYYICWGCLVWVPSVYTSPILYLVNHPLHLNAAVAFLILCAGLSCVAINYWADRQRQMVRATQGNCKIWFREPKLIHAEYTTEQGERKQTVLLASGWWSVARHFHYVPEIAGAFFWTLPAFFNNVLPWFYVVFLTILLVDRAFRDEQRCSKKYGAYWQQYCALVPNRLLPNFLGRKMNRNASSQV